MSTKPAPSAAIALPQKAKKEHVIAALVERAKAKHSIENKVLNEARAAKKKELNDACITHLGINPSYVNEVSVGVCTEYISVRLEIPSVPAHIIELDNQLDALPHARPFDPAQAKREIVAHLSGQSSAAASVQALLADPSTVTALDGILEEMAA